MARELTDEEAMALPPAVAPRAPAAPARELTDDEVMAMPPAVAARPMGVSPDGTSLSRPVPTLGERFRANVGDAFRGGLAGAAIEGGTIAVGSTLPSASNDPTISPSDRASGQRTQGDDARDAARLDRGRFAEMPSFTEAPSIGRSVAEGGAALAGQVVGTMADPTSFIGAGIGPLLRRLGVNVGANVAADTAAQGINLAAATAIPAGMTVAPDILRAVSARIAARRATQPAAPGAAPGAPTADDILSALEPADLEAIARANNITDPNDPRMLQLAARLAPRRAAEAEIATPLGQRVRRAEDEQLAAENAAAAAEAAAARNSPEAQAAANAPLTPDEVREAAAAGELQPRGVPSVLYGAAPADRRSPDAEPGPVMEAPIGPAERPVVTQSTQEPLRLPSPDTPPSRPTTSDADIARMRAQMDAGNPNTATPPERLIAPDGRLPQTPDQVQSQREAGQAFTAAEAQRGRVAPGVRDTQPAARPQGEGREPVLLDDDFPVRILERRMVPNADGRMVEVARVERYDPRTGQAEDGSVPYEVPVRQLKQRNYAPDSERQAQDFAPRAESARDPEVPRQPGPGRPEREPPRTFTRTPEDPNTDFPGATARPDAGDGPAPGSATGRTPFPNQPEGPAPGQRWSRAEDAARAFDEAQARRRASGAQEPPPGAQARPGDAKGSTGARGQDADGRWQTDDRGFVRSTTEGPVRFATQLQAAKWIVNKGQKDSPDQVFEIAVHPSGKGFTVRETGRNAGDRARTDAPGAGQAAGASAPPPRPEPPPGPPLRLGGPERAPEPPPASRAAPEPEAPAPRAAAAPEPEAPRAAPEARQPGRDRPEFAAKADADEARIAKLEAALARKQAALAKMESEKRVPKDQKENRAALAAQLRADIAAIPRQIERARNAAKLARNAGARAAEGGDVPFQAKAGTLTDQQPATRAPGDPRNAGLIEAVRAAGGLRDTGGDAKNLGLADVPGLIRKDGWAWDAEALHDALQARGFYHLLDTDGRVDIAKLQDALQDARLGTNKLAPDDAAAQARFRAERAAEARALADMGREYGLGPDELNGITKRQFADWLAERKSMDELEAKDRALADELAADTARLADERAKVMAERGDSWEPDITDAQLRAEYGPASAISKEEFDARFDEVQRSDAAGPADRAGGGGRGPDDAAEATPAGGSRAAEGDAPRGAGDGDGTRSTGADPLKRTVDDGGQAVIPGAEASTKQATAARETATGRIEPKAPQKPVGSDGGLFDTGARDQTDMFASGAKAAKDGPTLFSNPFFAPQVWRGLFDALGATARNVPVLRDWVSSMGAFAKEVRGPDKAKSIVSGWRAALYASDSEMRAIADRVTDAGGATTRVAREALHDFLDTFHARAGEGRGAGKTFDEAVSARVTQRINDMAKAVGQYMDDDKALGQIVKMLQSGRIDQTTPMGKAAGALRDFLAAERKYLLDAGIDVGKVGNYFPRVPDTAAISARPAAFLAAAEKAFIKAGLSPADAKISADNWRLAVMTKTDPDSPSLVPGAAIEANFIKGRTLTKEADEILREFLVQDPRQVLTGYISSATRRAEWTRRVGPKNEKWDALVDVLRKSENGEQAIGPLKAYLSVMNGTNAHGLSPRFTNNMGWLRTWATIGLLEKATLSSLAEVIMPTMRAGGGVDALRNLNDTMRTIAGDLRGKGKAVERRELAEDLGIISSQHSQALNAARWAGGDVNSALQQKVMQKFFERTGLEQWTAASRVAATGVGQTFMRRLALDTAAGGSKARRANFLLRELGIPEKDVAGMAAWLAKQNDGIPDNASIMRGAKNPNPYAEAYRTALTRFVDQSILRPSAATRPRWASHPLGAVIFHIQNYQAAFQKNVLNRSARILFDGQLSKADKARMTAGQAVPMLTAIWAAQLLVGEGRDAIFGNPDAPPTTGNEKLLRAFSRAGGFGAADPVIQWVTGVKYQRDVATSALGPVIGRGASAVQTGIEAAGARNSPNTNAAERKFAQTAYDIIFEPAVNFALAGAPGGAVAKLTAAAITQAVGSGTAREAAVSAVAGQRENSRGSGSGGFGSSGNGFGARNSGF
jgi:hypothetical protein